MTLSIDAHLTVSESHKIECLVRERVLSTRKDVRELKVHVHPWSEEEEATLGHAADNHLEGDSSNAKETRTNIIGQEVKVVKSDFGRDGC